MNSALTKTAAAIVTATLILGSAAFAETSTVDENINLEVAIGYDKIYNLVSISVEERIAELQVKKEQPQREQPAKNQNRSTS